MKQNAINSDVIDNKNLKIVYSPLHGTAGRPVTRVLKKMRFMNVFNVKEQIRQTETFQHVILQIRKIAQF